MLGSSSSKYARISRITAESSAISTRTMSSSTGWDSHESANDFEEVRLVETRLDDVGVGAHLDTALFVFSGCQSRHQNDRQVGQLRIRPDTRSQFEAIHTGHVHVREDEIDRRTFEGSQGHHPIQDNQNL